MKLWCKFPKKNDLCFDCLESRHSKKNCKNTVILDFIIVSGVTTFYHCKRNQNQLAQRDNKGSTTTLQNQIQHEEGEIQENRHNRKVEEKLSHFIKGNTSVILQTASAIAVASYENKFSMAKSLLDSGYQQTFKEKLANELHLKPVREVPVDINPLTTNVAII